MTGIQLAELLHADGFGDTPIIAMLASPRMLKAAITSNLFASTMAKPFDLVALLDTVTHCASPGT